MAEIKRSLAVVIGINQYVNGIPELKTAVNDAIEIAHILETKYQYQVLRLLDEEATGAHLEELFAAFEQQTLPLSDSDRAAKPCPGASTVGTLGASRTTIQLHPDDRLLFYFAGHGIALDALSNADGPVGFLVPQDARMDNDSSLLPMKRLHDALLALPCRHLLVILDCCFAGAFRWAGQREMVRSQKMYRERYERFISGCAQQVITSAADDEKAADSLYCFGQRSEHEGHSPFAESLLKGLSGAADYTGDGVITATELYVYIHGELGKTSAKQTPAMSQLKRHDKGEYIFPIPSFEPNELDQAPVLDENANPYKGLESFEENDSDKFFGRKALTGKLQEFVTINLLTVVLGASGSGKSSLVKAGLIPLLKKNQESWRVLPPIRPGESPFNALNKALERENLPVFAIPNQVSNSSDNSQWYEQGLQNLSANLTAWRNLHPNSKLLLVIDQSEEVITLCRSDMEREMFLSGLARALKAFPDWLRIVLTLRSDFEPQVRETALEPYWSGARFIVPAMTREELRQAIVEPASAKVMYFEPPTLVDQLIDEVMQMPGALPLLSFTLSELYLKYIKSVREGKRNNRAITQEDYEELGGVARSLTQRADWEYDELVKVEPAYKQTLCHVMLRMVVVGGGELARRRVFCTELEYPEPENIRVNEAIERFVAARLLVKGRDIENKEYVEPAHDVLVRGWQKLLNWKQQEQETLILQRRLTPAALEWKSQQQAKFLWNADPRLDLLKQVLNSSHNWFNTLETEFVQQTIKQKRTNAIRLWSSVTGALIVLSATTFIAINKARNALNLSLETYVASSEAYLSSGRELEALTEGVKAGKLLKKNQYWVREETRMQVLAHLGQLIHKVRERNRWKKHDMSVESVSFSPDGQLIASASKDHTIKLWRRDGSPLQTLSDHKDYVFRVSFCRDGQMLISASEDQTVKLWQRQSDNQFKLIKSIPDQEERIESVALSPDCQTIATSTMKSTVKLWSREGKPVKTFTEKHRDQVRGLDFSPDGQLIASASLDETIKLWRRKDGKLLKTIRDDGAKFYGVRFVDNKTLASASDKTSVNLWDLKGNKLKTVGKHDDEVLHLDVSRDGKTIVSTSEDGTVRLWNVKPWSQEKAEKLLDFKVPSGIVKQVSFSPNGETIVLGGDDATVRLLSRDGMDLSPKNLQGNSLSISPDSKMIVLGDKDGNVKLWPRDGKLLWNRHAHKKDVQRVKFSPNGKIIASASLDGTVKLWNLNGELIQTLPEHKGGVQDVSFSPDGTTIASASNEMVKLWHWNGTSFSNFRNFSAHNGAVTSVSFSPDGKTIASASRDDKIVKLWRLDGTLVRPFSGHQEGVFGVSFSPDGKIIASASSDSTVKIWPINRNSFPEELKEHDGNVYKVIFSSNGQVLASVGEDQTIKIWGRDGRLLKTLLGHGDQPVWDVSFSHDGKVMASIDFSQKIVVWNLNLDDFLENSCNWINHLDANNRNNVCNNV